MAFKSKATPNIGTSGSPSTVTATVASGNTATLIGLSLANTTATNITVSAKLVKADATEAFLVKDATVLPGGALAIGVGDRLQMLQYSTYSVISPEGCASILWKSADKASDAAEAMGLTAPRLQELGLVDEVVDEPLGGAHRDPAAAAARLRRSLVTALDELSAKPLDALIASRMQRLRGYGNFSS